ncbi:MAG: trypsin-like peptidase domain-containing protein [Chthoniobacteraceae bacterium]
MLRPPTAILAAASLAFLPKNSGAQQYAPEREPTTPALSLLRQIDEGFVQIFERVAPSVVVIQATKAPEQTIEDELDELRIPTTPVPLPPREGAPDITEQRPTVPDDWKLPQPPSRSEGSGFIIRADGFVLTNHHVVDKAEKLNVRLKDGRNYPARVVGFDEKTDIAVLKVDAEDLKPIRFGDSDALRVGQLVCAIGAPYNQDYSFTCGWVSGKGRTNLLGPTSPNILYEDYIQTDALINPGNSGGPLFDVDGRVVGMNTLINGIGRGLAFAIPANILQRISAELIETGRIVRPWLGVRIESLADNEALRERVIEVDNGVVVNTIEAEAPAYKSDLRPADIIMELDGVKLATAHDLQKEVLKKKVGQTLQLTVWRNGSYMIIPVMTGELPVEMPPVTAVAKRSSPFAKGEIFGLKLRDGKGGALVVAVQQDSPADLAEIFQDDLITAVESKPVADAVACLAALRSAEEKRGNRGVLLSIERKGRRTFALLNLAE